MRINSYQLLQLLQLFLSVFATDIYQGNEGGYFNLQNRFWEISLGSILFIKRIVFRWHCGRDNNFCLLESLVVLMMPKDASFLLRNGDYFNELVLVTKGKTNSL